MEGGGISGLIWILKPAITTTRQLYMGEERKSLGKKKKGGKREAQTTDEGEWNRR